MRHAISWSDLAGRRVGVWGLGTEGHANVRRLRVLGVEATVVDDTPQSPEVLPTGGGGLEALARCEVVVKTPGISRYRADVQGLERASIPVVGGLGLWMEEAPRERVVCITGTKGKSTTTTILGHLLRRLGRRVFVGGNLGLPPWDPAAEGDADAWVIETSSYQATDLASSPAVVGVTSLSPDHLPWHGDVGTYFRDKLSLCTLPGPHVVIANGADHELRARAELLSPDLTWVDLAPERPAWVSRLGLLGDHNDRNALMARACIRALGISASAEALADAAEGMAPLESRLELVGIVDGVRFVDDSLSTNVLPTVAALQAFRHDAVAVVVGGMDRGIDYWPLGTFLRTRTAETLVLAIPSNGEAILAQLGDVGDLVTQTAMADLPAAVAQGFAWARRRAGVVLLSPAAASFDHFRDYRHRAAVFADAMRACAAGPAGAER